MPESATYLHLSSSAGSLLKKNQNLLQSHNPEINGSHIPYVLLEIKPCYTTLLQFLIIAFIPSYI